MNSKLQAKIAAIVTGAFGFVAWLSTVPPEQQSGLLGMLVNVLPPKWQPTIGLWSKFLTTFAGIWAVYKASHAGPQTPPQNSPKD